MGVQRRDDNVERKLKNAPIVVLLSWNPCLIFCMRTYIPRYHISIRKIELAENQEKRTFEIQKSKIPTFNTTRCQGMVRVVFSDIFIFCEVINFLPCVSQGVDISCMNGNFSQNTLQVGIMNDEALPSLRLNLPV